MKPSGTHIYLVRAVQLGERCVCNGSGLPQDSLGIGSIPSPDDRGGTSISSAAAPHFGVALDQVVTVSSEDGIGIERDLEFAVRQFFNNVKHVPPGLSFIGRIIDRLDVSRLNPQLGSLPSLDSKSGGGSVRSLIAIEMVLRFSRCRVGRYSADCWSIQPGGGLLGPGRMNTVRIMKM